METNNFGSLPNTRELWVRIGTFTFKAYYDKEGVWWEGIQKKAGPEILLPRTDDMEAEYLSNAILAYRIFAREQDRYDIDFAGRTISFCQNTEFGDNINIQTEKEDEEGIYSIELLQIKKEQWLEIAQFFNLSSALFLNFEDFTKKRY